MKLSFKMSNEQDLTLYQNELINLGLSSQTVTITEFETPQHPMHPNLYFQLTGVRGFCEINGKDYTSYLKMWRERKESYDKAPSDLKN